MSHKIFKYLLILLVCFAILVAFFLNLDVFYPKGKFDNPRMIFLKEIFKEIPYAEGKKKIALVLDSDFEGIDNFLPLEKGYKLIIFDKNLNYYELIFPPKYKDRTYEIIFPEKYRNKTKVFSENGFESLPGIDLLIVNSIVPFFGDKGFKAQAWVILDSKVGRGGYGIFFLTEAEIAKYLRGYEILKKEKIEKTFFNEEPLETYYGTFVRKK